MSSSFPAVHAMLNSARGYLFSPWVPMPNAGLRVGHLTAVYCLAEERKQVAGGKAPEPGFDVRPDHGLAVNQLHGDVRADRVPVMEDQFPWLPRDATACLRARGCRAAYRHDRQTSRPVVHCMGRTQIVLFGVTPGSHMTDQVAALRRHCTLSFDAPASLSVMPGWWRGRSEEAPVPG
jgi:hypothetical protein